MPRKSSVMRFFLFFFWRGKWRGWFAFSQQRCAADLSCSVLGIILAPFPVFVPRDGVLRMQELRSLLLRRQGFMYCQEILCCIFCLLGSLNFIFSPKKSSSAHTHDMKVEQSSAYTDHSVFFFFFCADRKWMSSRDVKSACVTPSRRQTFNLGT